MMTRIEAAIILSVSLAAGAAVFMKIAFPELGNTTKKDESEIEIDLDEDEVMPE